MKNSEIKSLSTEELIEKLKSESDALRKMKFSHSISPLENPMRLKETRRLVARLKTELRAKELAN